MDRRLHIRADQAANDNERNGLRRMRWGPALAAGILALTAALAGSVFETAVGQAARQPLVVASQPG